MRQRVAFAAIGVMNIVLVTAGLGACSSDEEPSQSTAGTGGKGGSAGKGGSSGSTAGTSGAGGSAGAKGDAGDPYECEDKAAKSPRDPGGSGAEAAACCGGLGSCVKATSVTGPGSSSYGHDSCKRTTGADDLRCAPTASSLAEAGVAGVFNPCTAKLGTTISLEGRCLPKCFIQGNSQVNQLSSAGCAAADAGAGEQVCAPCYNPVDGTATGACSQKPGDMPAQPAPPTFKACGATDASTALGGLCVPTDLATASGNPAAASLPQLECATGEVCAPSVKVKDLNGCFARCTTSSTVTSLGAEYGAGACVPYYVVASNPMTATGVGVLEQGSCATGELCAPCFNPLTGGVPTGACQ